MHTTHEPKPPQSPRPAALALPGQAAALHAHWPASLFLTHTHTELPRQAAHRPGAHAGCLCTNAPHLTLCLLVIRLDHAVYWASCLFLWALPCLSALLELLVIGRVLLMLQDARVRGRTEVAVGDKARVPCGRQLRGWMADALAK